jgi:hypothetical protein
MGKLGTVLPSFPSFTWERPCGGNFIADPNPSINRSQREMKFRGDRKRSQVKLGSEETRLPVLTKLLIDLANEVVLFGAGGEKIVPG